MTYDRFEDLPVWKAAARLFVQVDRLCESEEVGARGDVADQLHRATLSISNNIAEGFEEGSREQLITYLYHAKGSAGEVRSMLTVLCGTPRFQPLRGRLSELRTLAEEVSRQLAGFLGSLQNSDLRGHRYLNDAVREQRERAARAAAFDERIKAIVKEARGSAEGTEAGDGPADA
jgi:four helix bundle protein